MKITTNVVLRRFKSSIISYWNHEKWRIIVAIISVFVFGLIAHGFAFSNLTLSHDSLVGWDVLATKTGKIGLGRFFMPLYHLIFCGSTTMPWLAGMYSLVWISISTCFVINMLHIKKYVFIVLTAAILVVNVTVSAGCATFCQDIDANMFGVLCACIAAKLWQRNNKASWLSILFLFIALGIYQCIISVFLLLVIFISIFNLINNKKTCTVIIHGLKSIAMVFIAGILYYICAKLICNAFNVNFGSGYNSLNNLGSATMLDALLSTPSKLLFYYTHSTVRNAKYVAFLFLVLAVILIICLIRIFLNKQISLINKLLVIPLLLLAPFAMNVSYILSGGLVLHTLMIYSYWLILPFVLQLCEWCYVNSYKNVRLLSSVCKMTGIIITAVLIIFFIQTSNAIYLNKELNREATQSYMTEVMNTIDHTPGYVHGETPVCFVGFPALQKIPEYDNLANIADAQGNVLTYYGTYYNYFNLMLERPVNLVNSETAKEIINDSTVQSMPNYPSEYSLKWINGILVVKLSDCNEVI